MLQIILVLGISSFIIIILLFFIQVSFSSNNTIGDNQLTMIESGFENLSSSIFMSTSFFMLATLFVLFDMELILLLFCITFHYMKMIFFYVILFAVFLFISVTLMIEWKFHGLKWSS